MSKEIIFAFVLGASIGSVVTWKFIKTKYEQLAQEEIDSVKAVFSKRKEHEEEKSDILDDNYNGETSDYENLVTSEGYNTANKEKGVAEMNDKPYVITPDEFGDTIGYDTESLTYYADGVLADDYDNPIENVDELVGVDSLNHFGEYEEDSVFVRNDRYATDYEILRDVRNFSDVADLSYSPTVNDE